MTEDSRPPRVPPRIRQAPRIRQIYWCDFPADAQLPEFSKRRPVLILSRASKLHGSVAVLPLTTKSQPDNRMAYPIDIPNMQLSWVICDYLATVAVSRLHLPGRTALRVG
ncbi:MAG: type II toxin-antitoxin system PemK/MazF family toxin [Albidovulum sp.]|nr:type II toxin-antitoxin system PemK/MazF family toxin [Albidovulum sp.]